MIRVGIIGGGGLVACEIMKILYNHPKSEVVYATSETFESKSISQIHTCLQDMYDDIFFQKYLPDAIKEACDVIFICRTHGESSSIVKDFINSNCKIIDMGADFRLHDINNFNFWYHGAKHSCPEMLNNAIYGLPELYSTKIKNARLIANPGCYATSIILAGAPILKSKLVNSNGINIVSCSGISGAGNQPRAGFNIFMDVYRNLKPYKIGVHPHIGEIEQELKNFSPDLGPLTFIPQVVPMDRGIMSILTFTVNPEITEEIIKNCYNNFYNGSSFIKIKNSMPETKDVIGTNACLIYPKIDNHSNKLVVFSTLDNLIKGAAGQAVQNMNLMFNLSDSIGLN